MDATMDDGNGGTPPTDGSLASQMPLPNPPGPDSASHMNSNGDSASDHSSSQPQRNRSQRSKSNGDTGNSDETIDAGAMSDADSTVDDGSVGKTGGGKKKKSQRFYCTEYPPCSLSFTRSEHLARHIRKHTGERPFECHCQRRFSRLDNLRQHAQTVHMHEDIPISSLAATGTRFQRQIRTDRVRAPVGGRARATSSASMSGGPTRGHSKSFSTSNIALGSMIGSAGPFSPRDDMRDMRDMQNMRPRPPPLAALDARARQHMEGGIYHATADGYRPITPPELTTPTSSIFSNGPASPRWGSNRVVSPPPFHSSSRPHSMYAATEAPGGRRLSVPSADSVNFQSPPSGPRNTSRHMYSMSASSNGVLFPPPDRSTNNAGRPVSPDNSSISTGWSRRESFSSTTDEAMRRRTWHPSSRDFGGAANRNGTSAVPSGAPVTSVSANNVINGPPSHYQQTGPEAPLPLANPATQQSSMRLPGIDSFLNMPSHRPVSPPRRGPSPMAIDSERYPPAPAAAAASGPPTSILRSPMEQHHPLDSRRPSSGHWESGLQHGLNRLDIASRTPPQDSARDWVKEGHHQAQQAEELARRSQQQQHPSVRFESDVARDDPFSANGGAGGGGGGYSRGHQHTVSAPAFNAATSRSLKRQAWYNGPSGAAINEHHHAAARVERMVHPNLANGFAGFPARGVPQTVHEHQPQDQDVHRIQDAYRKQQAQEHGGHDRYQDVPVRPVGPPRDFQDAQRQQQQQQQHHQHQHQQQQTDTDSYRRLDALVAVATSEVKASTQAF